MRNAENLRISGHSISLFSGIALILACYYAHRSQKNEPPSRVTNRKVVFKISVDGFRLSNTSLSFVAVALFPVGGLNLVSQSSNNGLLLSLVCGKESKELFRAIFSDVSWELRELEDRGGYLGTFGPDGESVVADVRAGSDMLSLQYMTQEVCAGIGLANAFVSAAGHIFRQGMNLLPPLDFETIGIPWYLVALSVLPNTCIVLYTQI